MLPQAPEFDRFLRPYPIVQLHAVCTMGPGLRRDGVICSEGAMKANWITASFAGESHKLRLDDFTPTFAGMTGGEEETTDDDDWVYRARQYGGADGGQSHRGRPPRDRVRPCAESHGGAGDEGRPCGRIGYRGRRRGRHRDHDVAGRFAGALGLSR